MVNFTIGDVVADVRVELGDTYEGAYSYLTADIVRYIGEGIVALRELRPSTAYDPDTGRLLHDDDKWASLNEADTPFFVPVTARYRKTLAAYAMFKCLSRDDTDRGNAARADAAYKRFVETAAT